MRETLLNDYQQAQKIIQGYLTGNLVLNDAVFSHWIIDKDGCESRFFWYLRQLKDGKEFRLVDVLSSSNDKAFDHGALALLLEGIVGEYVDPGNLPITKVSMEASPLKISFLFKGRRWCYDPRCNECVEKKCTVKEERESPQYILSPDELNTVFVRENNLWLRDVNSGSERPLTEDGKENCGYGIALKGQDKRVQARWSPDSSWILTVQQNTESVGSLPVVSYVPQNGDSRPDVNQFKFSLSGDEFVESYRLFAIEVDTGFTHAVDYPPLPYVYLGPETFDGFFSGDLGWWSSDGQNAFFIDICRASKRARLMKWNIASQAVSLIFEESSKGFIKLCEDTASSSLFLPLPETDELIWFSERSGWGHLYLYDLNAGVMKHEITLGDWIVRGVLHYDKNKRELLLQTGARNSDISPYYRDICKINIDSCELKALITGNYDHIVHSGRQGFSVVNRASFGIDSDDAFGVSPCGRYIVITYSRVDVPPVSVLIDREGNKICTLEVTDISGLPEGWEWPEPVKMTADDEKTNIYGVVFRPPKFSEENSYPVVDFCACARHVNLIPQGSFINSHFTSYYEMAALSAIGFVVVAIAGRGTPLREKGFHEYSFGRQEGEDALIDHIAGLRQLALRYPYMDIGRVGITSLEAPVNVLYGSFMYSDFYKVTVSHVFIDRRDVDSSQEMYSGIVDRETLLKTSGPESYIETFGGKVLLITGLLSGVAGSTLRLVEALQSANKDFDMLCMPSMGTTMTSYTRRRGWDYLVEHLIGVSPPPEFKLITGWDIAHENSHLQSGEII